MRTHLPPWWSNLKKNNKRTAWAFRLLPCILMRILGMENRNERIRHVSSWTLMSSQKGFLTKAFCQTNVVSRVTQTCEVHLASHAACVAVICSFLHARLRGHSIHSIISSLKKLSTCLYIYFLLKKTTKIFNQHF